MLPLSAAVAQADPSTRSARAPSVETGAELAANVRLALFGCSPTELGDCSFQDFHDAVVLTPWVEADPDPRVAARAEIALRLHGPTGALTVDADAAETQPASARVEDAWVAARGDHLELRAGAQRVAWGVADGISLVDNVNPWNLEDPTRFDRRLSQVVVRGIAHGGELEAQLAYAPFFVPAALPVPIDYTRAALAFLRDPDQIGFAGDVDIRDLDTSLELPGDIVSTSLVAARVLWAGRYADVAISGLHGPDSLPQIDGSVLVGDFNPVTGAVDLVVPFAYPIVDQAGVEVRGELVAAISAWAEVLVVAPSVTQVDANDAIADLQAIGLGDLVPRPELTQDGKPYVKWILGLDRSFGPVLLNVQWLHGFPTERRRDTLRDYVIPGLRISQGKVKVEAAALTDGEAFFADGELTVLHADLVELSIGAAYITGPLGNTLTAFQPASHLRLGSTMAF